MASRGSISRTVEIDAPAERVFALVSDLPGMGELSPENTGGRWLGGATAPAVGVRFRGSNRNGWRRWSTVVRVRTYDPPHRFAFDVDSVGLAVSRWSYDVAPRPGGCTVTETWADRRGRAMDVIGLLASGVSDRASYTAQSIEHTLAALKARAEQQPAATP
jgi:uncharacterized protein YndB with AHSA1/START domain